MVRKGEVMKILLAVDDSKENQYLVHAYLSNGPSAIDCQITYADNGRSAVEKFKNSSFDLVLMDLQMPEMDGYETLRQIRAFPACTSVPVVAITAFAMLDDRQKAFEAGFDGYFAKPINIAALRTQIDSLLK